MDDLDRIADAVEDRASFVRFLEALRSDLRRELARGSEERALDDGEWGHPDLEGFLEAWAAWLDDLQPDSANWGSFGPALDSLEPRAWRAHAEMLLAARVYE